MKIPVCALVLAFSVAGAVLADPPDVDRVWVPALTIVESTPQPEAAKSPEAIPPNAVDFTPSSGEVAPTWVPAMIRPAGSTHVIPEHRKSDKVFEALRIANIGAGAMDLTTTLFAIEKGYGYESNPLLKPLQDQPIAFGAVKAAQVIGLHFGLKSFHKKNPKAARWTAFGLLALNGFVVLNNARVIAKH